MQPKRLHTGCFLAHRSDRRDDGRVKSEIALTVRMPVTLHVALAAAAKADRRSMASWIVITLEQAIAEAASKRKR